MISKIKAILAFLTIVFLQNSVCEAQGRPGISQWENCIPDYYKDQYIQDQYVIYLPDISSYVVRCLVDSERYSDAVDFLKWVIELDSPSIIDQLPNQKLLAEVYELSGRLDDAESRWAELIRSFSSGSDLHRDITQELQFRIGNFFLRTGRPDEAKRIFIDSASIVSKDDQANPYYLKNLRALLEIIENEGDPAEVIIIADKIARAVRYGIFVGAFGKDEMIRASNDLARVEIELRELR